MDANWNTGMPPRDARVYEVRQRNTTAGGHAYTVQDALGAFWNGNRLCRKSQLHGGIEPLVLMNEWRVATPL